MSLPPIFSNKSEVFSCEFLLSKKFNLILLHWQLPFIVPYFLLVFSYFLDCQLSHRRVPLGSEKIFSHHLIRNCYSSIELSMLITNIRFLLRIDSTIANIWSTFWRAWNRFLSHKFIEIQFLIDKNKLNQRRMSFPIRTS